MAAVCCLAGGLYLSYDSCIKCVVCIAIVSGLTINCVPLMPLVFATSIGVILLHSVDYNKATIKLEVPIQDVIYVPTWSDLQEYVKLVPAK